MGCHRTNYPKENRLLAENAVIDGFIVKNVLNK